MATTATIKKNIAKLEAALKSKATPKSLKPKLETQLVKSKAELSGMNKGTKPKTSSTKSTQTALQKLKEMVNKNKKYKTYKGAGVDLEKDADRPALRTGRRIAKESGKTYYEYRANRIDVKQPPKKYPKLEKGGYMAKGGELTPKDKLIKELQKLQTQLNSSRLSQYREGDNSEEEMARQKERKSKLDRFNEILEVLKENDKMAKGGEIDYSKQTSDDFKLGEIVWDTDNNRYGTIIGIYDGYLSDKYEVRLDTDGMQPTENLRKVGSEGDKGTKEKLDEEIKLYARLIKNYPKNNYPQQRKEFVGKYAEGGISEKEVVESNAEMVLSKIKEVKHHAQELSNVVSKNSDIEAWVVAKIERASTDLSDITHYLEFQTNKMAMGGEIHRTQD
jgi:hypothetical protein